MRSNPHGLPVEGRGPEVTGHAFIWQHGKAYDLNACLNNGTGWILTDAKGINDKGQIVGMGLLETVPKSSNRKMTAYLLIPQ